MSAEEEPTKRVAMLWPESVETEVRERVGNRGRTDFTLDAVRIHLRGVDRIDELEKQLNEARYSCQLFADQLVMGGDKDDRLQRLMEVEFPHWISSDGWPTAMAERVQAEPVDLDVSAAPKVLDLGKAAPGTHVPKQELGETVRDAERRELAVQSPAHEVRLDVDALGEVVPSPVTAPDPAHNHEWDRSEDGILHCACGSWIDESTKPGKVEQAKPVAEPVKQSAASTIDVAPPPAAVAKEGRTDLFARIMEKTGGAIDPALRDMQVASELPTPVEKPVLTETAPAIDVLEAGKCPNCHEDLIDGECWTCG